MKTVKLPFTGTGTKKMYRDKILEGDNNVVFLFDLYHPYTIGEIDSAGGSILTDPINDDTVYDVSENENSRFHVKAGQTLDYVESIEAVDFTGLTDRGTYVELPASVSQKIWEADQNFLVCGYFTMPTQHDFNGGTAIFNPKPMMAATMDNPITDSNIFSISQQASGVAGVDANQFIVMYRQIDHTQALVDARNVDISGSSVFGSVCQIAFWRNNTESGLRIKTQTEEIISTFERGADNVNDFSALKIFFGVSDFWRLQNPEEALGSNFKLHRGFVETLPVATARDAITVLDLDWKTITSDSRFGIA